jgi:hypothetical protein
VFEVEVEDDLEVGPARRTRRPSLGTAEPSAEERVEQVAEPTETLRIAREPGDPFRAEAVIPLAPLGVRQDLVGLCDLLEPRFVLG